jgi:hypothetical protein
MSAMLAGPVSSAPILAILGRQGYCTHVLYDGSSKGTGSGGPAARMPRAIMFPDAVAYFAFIIANVGPARHIADDRFGMPNFGLGRLCIGGH